jgi:hypothetical protein
MRFDFGDILNARLVNYLYTTSQQFMLKIRDKNATFHIVLGSRTQISCVSGSNVVKVCLGLGCEGAFSGTSPCFRRCL